jgi:hypothetical protein
MAEPGEGEGALAEAAAAAVDDALRLQLDLLGLDETPALGKVRERRAKAGRPPGALNRRSDQAAAYVLSRLGDPLLHQAAVAVMGVAELAAAAGCTVMEAFAEKRLAAAVVLPYLHSRRPLDVNVNEHKIVRLTIIDAPPDQAAASGLDILGVVENQELSGGVDGTL